MKLRVLICVVALLTAAGACNRQSDVPGPQGDAAVSDTPAATAPDAGAETETAVAQSPEPVDPTPRAPELPATASPLPLFAVAGLLALAGALAARFVRQR